VVASQIAFVRKGLPIWTLEVVSYPIENKRISGVSWQNHFWTIRGAIENSGLLRRLDGTAARTSR